MDFQEGCYLDGSGKVATLMDPPEVAFFMDPREGGYLHATVIRHPSGWVVHPSTYCSSLRGMASCAPTIRVGPVLLPLVSVSKADWILKAE